MLNVAAYMPIRIFEQCICDCDEEARVDGKESHHPTIVYDEVVVAVSLQGAESLCLVVSALWEIKKIYRSHASLGDLVSPDCVNVDGGGKHDIFRVVNRATSRTI